MKIQKVRQTLKLKSLILFLAIFTLTNQSYSQETETIDYSNVDYSAKSNILNPDTLKGDQKAIFWAFVKLTSKETEELKPEIIKAKFAGIGITIKENNRFLDAYSFYVSMTNHKISCEQWEYFKFLKPD